MLFLSEVTAHSTLICMTPFKTTLQRFGLSKTAIYVQTYRSTKKQMFHSIFSEVFVMTLFRMMNIIDDIVSYDEHYRKKCIKNEEFCPWFIFLMISHNHFSHKEPHLVMLGCIYCTFKNFKSTYHCSVLPKSPKLEQLRYLLVLKWCQWNIAFVLSLPSDFTVSTNSKLV